VPAKRRAKRKGSSRSLNLQIKLQAKSVASLEWGCAYAFPVRPEVAVPLIVVSDLYRSPATPR
jgi:hypothetical protein